MENRKTWNATASLELSEEYFNLLCVIYETDMSLSEIDKKELLVKKLHSLLLSATLTPIENYVRNTAILEAQKQIDLISQKAKENLLVAIE